MLCELQFVSCCLFVYLLISSSAFDMDTGELLWDIHNAHKGGVTAIQVSHNEKYIVSGGEQGEVRVWDVRSREMMCHLKEHILRVCVLYLSHCVHLYTFVYANTYNR